MPNIPDPNLLAALLISKSRNPDPGAEKPFDMGPNSLNGVIELIMLISSMDALVVIGALQGRILTDPSLNFDDKMAVLARLFEAEWDYAVCTNRLIPEGPYRTREDFVEGMIALARRKEELYSGEDKI